MISALNVFIYLSHPNLSAISSYCSLLTIDFDAICGDLWLLKSLFYLNMSVFILACLFYLSNFRL
jgi:hypothetical protein